MNGSIFLLYSFNSKKNTKKCDLRFWLLSIWKQTLAFLMLKKKGWIMLLRLDTVKFYQPRWTKMINVIERNAFILPCEFFAFNITNGVSSVEVNFFSRNIKGSNNCNHRSWSKQRKTEIVILPCIWQGFYPWYFYYLHI